MSTLTEAQHAARRSYLGGSDAPAIVGVNPPHWSQPIDVWAEKHGLAEPRPGSRMMDMGALMEDLVARLAGEALGVRWRRPGREVRSRRYPWAGGHVDRLGVLPDGRSALLECKWTMRRDGWGPSFTTEGEEQPRLEVPLHYAVQVEHYLAVTGRDVAVLAVLLGYADFRWYLIERDEARLARLMELEEAWWTEHGPPDGPAPQPDGSDSYARHLRAKYAQDDASEAVATAAQQAMADRLHVAIEARKAAERAEAEAAQVLQRSMGNTAKLVGPGFTINWRTSKPPLKVEWEPLATELVRLWRLSRGANPPLPDTKKAVAALVRDVAREMGFASEGEPSRPWKPQFDADTSDEEE